MKTMTFMTPLGVGLAGAPIEFKDIPGMDGFDFILAQSSNGSYAVYEFKTGLIIMGDWYFFLVEEIPISPKLRATKGAHAVLSSVTLTEFQMKLQTYPVVNGTSAKK